MVGLPSLSLAWRSARGTLRLHFFNSSRGTLSSMVSLLLVWHPLTRLHAALLLNIQVCTKSMEPSRSEIITDVCYAGSAIRSIDLTFVQANARSILERSPVSYVKTMQLHGSLFASDCNTGAVSSVFTGFYVDHQEPLHRPLLCIRLLVTGFLGSSLRVTSTFSFCLLPFLRRPLMYLHKYSYYLDFYVCQIELISIFWIALYKF